MRRATGLILILGSLAIGPAAFALPTPGAREGDALEHIKREAWGVVLPDPHELLLDDEAGEVLFDAPTEGERRRTLERPAEAELEESQPVKSASHPDRG